MNNEETIMMGHGSGGLMMKRLIDSVFFKAYAGNSLKTGDDAATLDIGGKKISYSTDSFVVTPHFFAGGNIGKLAVCGTVNDVSTAGAVPIALSVSMILEEGFPLSDLKQICSTIKETADEAGVEVVTGDTKVLSLGSAGMPGVGVITAVSMFSAVNLPIAAVVLLMPINNITDMIRTMNNVTNASVATAVVARKNGLLNDDVFNAEEDLVSPTEKANKEGDINE